MSMSAINYIDTLLQISIDVMHNVHTIVHTSITPQNEIVSEAE